MTFPNPNFDQQALRFQVKQVLESHGQPLENLDEKTREFRSKKEGGVEIKPYEIPWIQHMVIERVKTLENEIKELQKSIDNYTAPNLESSQERLRELMMEDDYLRNNFAEKFFENTSDIDKK